MGLSRFGVWPFLPESTRSINRDFSLPDDGTSAMGLSRFGVWPFLLESTRGINRDFGLPGRTPNYAALMTNHATLMTNHATLMLRADSGGMCRTLAPAPRPPGRLTRLAGR